MAGHDVKLSGLSCRIITNGARRKHSAPVTPRPASPPGARRYTRTKSAISRMIALSRIRANGSGAVAAGVASASAPCSAAASPCAAALPLDAA